ncbi:hypothetical protein FPOA_23378 [Fusarium poae]|uniref:HTH CENPB-type domain-containing protein n=1 Tax=Fusarium poae TaxID=36050 RepID=A0A1B8AR13_FUSPO|nr:hypothetical protein FPOA_23378 [Fusarium poae]
MPSFTEKDMSAALQMVADVREFASKIAVRNGFLEGVGKNWLQGFLGRNPDIRTLKGILYAPYDAGDMPSQAGEQI